VGAVHREVALLVEHGLSVESALHSATAGGHDYLGSADRGDLVTYDRDPRDDPAILATPAAVVIRGTRVH
jgi:imidazolonepropionase-like amidohydrolase